MKLLFKFFWKFLFLVSEYKGEGVTMTTPRGKVQVEVPRQTKGQPL
jgi:hypothetical protein